MVLVAPFGSVLNYLLIIAEIGLEFKPKCDSFV
jgi:hypothetical protein